MLAPQTIPDLIQEFRGMSVHGRLLLLYCVFNQCDEKKLYQTRTCDVLGIVAYFLFICYFANLHFKTS